MTVKLDIDTYIDTDIQTFEEYCEIVEDEQTEQTKVNKGIVLTELRANCRESVVMERCQHGSSDPAKTKTLRSHLRTILLVFRVCRMRRNKAHAAPKKIGSFGWCFTKAIRLWLAKDEYEQEIINQTFQFKDQFNNNYKRNCQFVRDKCDELYKSYNNNEDMDMDMFNVEIKKATASVKAAYAWRTNNLTYVRKDVYDGEGTNNTSDPHRGDAMRKNLDGGAGILKILNFVGADNNEPSYNDQMKRLGEIIACMEKLRKKVANKQAVSMDDVDRHLWEYFSIGDTKKSYSFADADRRSIMAMAHSKLKGVWGDIRTKGLICNTYEELLGKGGKVDRYLQKRDKDDHHSAGIRMFTIACSKERVENVARYCYDGHGACIPIKMCGAEGYLVFSVGGTSEEDVLVTGPDDEVELMHWKFTICPGDSIKHHGGRENNKHSVQLSPDLFWSPTTGIFFETAKDTDTGAASHIKNKEHRESGRWDTLQITIDDVTRGIRRCYLSSDGKELLTTFNLKLPMAFRINNLSTAKRLSHHRWIAISMHALGLDRTSKDGMKFRGTNRSWEEMYLSTGGTQVDNDDIEQQRELIEYYNLEGVEMPELQPEEVEVNIPQGQCDVDHCLHRYHWITNSMYLAFAMSHTSNTKNSIKRRGVEDWCFLLSEEEYINGE